MMMAAAAPLQRVRRRVGQPRGNVSPRRSGSGVAVTATATAAAVAAAAASAAATAAAVAAQEAVAAAMVEAAGGGGSGGSSGAAVATVEAVEDLATQQHVQDATHPAAARLVTRLRRFSLADAHCFDPNEERQLRAAIEAMPGGGEFFQATIRRLGTRFNALVRNPTPGSAAGKAMTAHGMANQAGTDPHDQDFSYLPVTLYPNINTEPVVSNDHRRHSRHDEQHERSLYA